MLWNDGMNITYSDYKISVMQKAGWKITPGTEIESVGFVTYTATKGNQRVVMSFNENNNLIKLTGSQIQKMGMATYSKPYDKEASERFMKYFNAI